MKDLRCTFGLHDYGRLESPRTDRAAHAIQGLELQCKRCQKSKFVTLMKRVSVQRERGGSSPWG
jgi:hypothetical protein